MKQAIKKLVSAIPGGERLLKAYRAYAGQPSPEAHFTNVYRARDWGASESVSGSGSTLQYTENIRKELPTLFERLNVRRVLDAPCGDYNWFQHIPRESGPDYTGGDIVAPLVASNQQRFGNSNTRFIKLDIINDRLPSADLWLCRDALFHFSHEHTFKVLDNFLRADIRYFVTTTLPGCEANVDGPTGPFRMLNLEISPFFLGRPSQTIDDWIEGYPVRHLGVWEKSDLARALASNPAMAPYRRGPVATPPA